MATSIAIQQEALTRAKTSQSLANYAAIVRGFMAKGLRESEISPRENVFTYNAWKALGRQVKRGEHGVKCITVITTTDKRTGREERRPWTTTVFHVSQTEPVGTERQSVRVPLAPPSPMPCYNAIVWNEPDATAENVPYAGEEEMDAAELLAHSEAVHAERKPAPDATDENVPFAGEDEGTAPKLTPNQEKVLADILIPEPPKESASVRAMRGEQVSIMDIIAELPKRETPRSVPSFSGRIQRLIDRQRELVRNDRSTVRQQSEVNF